MHGFGATLDFPVKKKKLKKSQGGVKRSLSKKREGKEEKEAPQLKFATIHDNTWILMLCATALRLIFYSVFCRNFENQKGFKVKKYSPMPSVQKKRVGKSLALTIWAFFLPFSPQRNADELPIFRPSSVTAKPHYAQDREAWIWTDDDGTTDVSRYDLFAFPLRIRSQMSFNF